MSSNIVTTLCKKKLELAEFSGQHC